MAACSVIIVSFNTGPALFACVKAVLRQKQLAELIIVDNGNPPDVLARLQQMALAEPKIKIVGGHGNIGFAAGCNRGAAEANADFVMVLEPECLLPPDALIDFMAALTGTQSARLAGPIMLAPNGHEETASRGLLLTPARAFFDIFKLRRKRFNYPDTIHETQVISRFCLCMRSADFQLLRGMDSGFSGVYEDLDLCARVLKEGGTIICVPKIRVTRMPLPASAISHGALGWRAFKNRERYFNKHFAKRYVRGLLPIMRMALFLRMTMASFKTRFFTRKTKSVVMINDVAAKRLMILATGLADLPEDRQFYGKTFLVTGATSQLGLMVVRRLIAAGAGVLAISRNDPIPYAHDHLRWIKGDLTDNKLHLEGYLVDTVVHCAPLPHLPPAINLLADAEVKRVIAFSSTSVFAKALSHNAFEKDMVDKLARAESAVAQKCTERAMDWTILRPTVMYGAGLDVSITSLAKFIYRFGFAAVYPPAFGRRQPVHVEDLAIAVLQCAENTVTYGKSYNLSGGEVITWRQMLTRLFDLCKRKLRIIETTVLPFALDFAGWVLHKKHINGEIARRMNDDLLFFHDDAKRDFSYHPRGFLTDGLKDIEGF